MKLYKALLFICGLQGIQEGHILHQIENLKELTQFGETAMAVGSWGSGYLAGSLSALAIREFIGEKTSYRFDVCESYASSGIFGVCLKRAFDHWQRYDDEICAVHRSMPGPLPAFKHQIDYKKQARYFLYGVATGASAHSVLKGGFDRKNFQLHDLAVPIAIATSSFVLTQMLQDEERSG